MIILNPLQVGDNVKIVDTMATYWIGKEAVITKVIKDNAGFYCYELNIGGGHWTRLTLKKI